MILRTMHLHHHQYQDEGYHICTVHSCTRHMFNRANSSNHIL